MKSLLLCNSRGPFRHAKKWGSIMGGEIDLRVPNQTLKGCALSKIKLQICWRASVLLPSSGLKKNPEFERADRLKFKTLGKSPI